MLKGVRFPRKAVMVNFLRACGVHDDRLAPWFRAWERVAVRESEISQRKTTYTIPAGQQRITAGVEPLIEQLRDEVSQLRADKDQLRLQLADIDRQRAEQEPHFTDAANARETRSPIASRRELGALLSTLRQAQGLTVKQVADHLMCTPAKVRNMEAGRRAGTLRDVRDLCDLYGVSAKADRDRMMKLAGEGKKRGWWQSYELAYADYVGLEAEATVISCFQSSVIHGLLQTADYARAGNEGAMPRLSPDQIDKQIEAKLTRQRILTQDDPPRLTAVLDEAALHRMFGGRKVMAVQLAKILKMLALPNIVVHVLPYERGAHPAMESNFTILELPSPTPGLVYVEGLIGSIHLERAEDLKRYREIFNRLQSIALNPERTADLITSLIRSYGDS
jgi:transcriptional regulator with XRE-family HTH domain